MRMRNCASTEAQEEKKKSAYDPSLGSVRGALVVVAGKKRFARL